MQPRRQGIALGHLEGDAGIADLGLGAHDPLRQRGRRDQAGMGDGLGRQAADLAQGQRDAGLFRQAGMAAGEDQPQPVVLDRLALVRAGAGVRHRADLFGDLAPGCHAALPAQLIDRLEPPGRDKPGDRVARDAGPRPLLGGGDEGVLQRLLGQVETAQQPDQRGEDPPPVATEQVLELGGFGEVYNQRKPDLRLPFIAGHPQLSAGGRGKVKVGSRARQMRSSRADPWSKTRRGAWIARQLILEYLLERRKRQPRGSFADCDGGRSPALTLVDGHAGYPAFNAPTSAREHE